MNVLFELTNDELIDPMYVTPYSGLELPLSWEKEELPRYDFQKKLKDLTFIKEDFQYFLSLEQSDSRCNLQTLRVLINCGMDAEDTELFVGTFSMANGSWDLDKCTVKFKVDTVDSYQCIDDNDDDVNVLDLGLTEQIISLGFEYKFEQYLCVGGDCIDHEELIEDKWVLWYTLGSGKSYLRQIINAPCDYIASSEWIVVEPCTNGIIKYAKTYSYVPFEQTYPSGGTSYFSLDINLDPISQVDNGMKLIEVMQELLNVSCNSYTLQSDFFQWNPENETNINYVTGETNKYRNLILFQKSDVKRPNTSNNATKAETNFIELLEEICNIFNCWYTIIDDYLRIEHVSWFQSNLGLNLATPSNKEKYLKGTRKYSYDETKLPNVEKFQFMESGSIDFVGTDIIYDSNCTNNNEENKSETVINNITTDIVFCLENPESESDLVSDDGFVLVACDQSNNVYFENGILEANTSLNNILGWAHLHDKLFRHARVLPEGNLNNEDVVFESTLPTIKQDKFNVIMPCSQIKLFNPLDQIRAALGWGFVQTAELNLMNCNFNLELLLNEIQDITYTFEYGDFDEDFDFDFD
ncbi:hypothetical protein [Gaetbulibacter sp. PBL-D1]|uniref:hypothetical protein n=1 Tax=Gaetbulibacter sp. PBL-D1 TaxID=3422594 RepID=UPI003D2F2CB4